MKDIREWLDHLCCSDCSSYLTLLNNEVKCVGCGRIYSQDQGIWRFLPSSVLYKQGKDKEKEGWMFRTEQDKKAGYEPPPEHYLSLPNHPHPYYQAAAWYLRIVMEIGKPWEGKNVLELGAAECWATRHFAEAGAQAAALDYDPDRMLKGQILLDRLPIRFLRVTGDAERLPFRNSSLDRIFCCSVLHHFFDLKKAVHEISRTLKPGGMFLGIHEAFHPPYFSKQRILAMSPDTIPNIAAGINECSYTAAQYRKTFQSAGLRFELIHPRWDVKVNENSVVVKPGIHIYDNPDFAPLMFTARRHLQNTAGSLSRLILRSGLWRIFASRTIFPLIRFHILNWSTKDKLIAAIKD